MFEVFAPARNGQLPKRIQGTTMSTTNSTTSPRDDDVERVIVVVLSFIFLFVGVLGNIAVIIYNIFLNHDKTPSSCLVTHLAFADLLVCLILYPKRIVSFFHAGMRNKELVFCKINRTTFDISLFLSIIILLSITIDKYLYIAKPLKYPLIVTTRRTRIFLSCIWLAALVQFPLVYIYMHTSQGREREKCRFPRTVVWFQAILQLVAICVMTILNYKMFKIVKQHRQRMASQFVLQPRQSEQVQSEQVQSEQNMTWLRNLAKELKAMKTFAIVVGVLACCFVPYIVMNTPRGPRYRTWFSKPSIRIVIPQLVGINSIANAFIYALRHKKYVRAYRKLFSSAWARLFSQNN
jgi:hypothetical protein